MNTFFSKILTAMKTIYTWIFSHKFITAIVILVIAGGGYYGVVKARSTVSKETRYVLGSAAMGTVITSVSGTGQVSASNQVDITSEASGRLISVPVKAGDSVSAGQLIAEVDPTDAAYELESAKLSYDSLVTIDPDDLRTAKESVTKAQEDLDSSYVSTRSSLVSASTDMTNIVNDLADLYTKTGYLSDQVYSRGDEGQKDTNTAEKSYYNAQKALENFTSKQKSLTSKSSDSDIESTLSSGYDTASIVAQAAKDARDAIAINRAYDKNNGKTDTTNADAAYTIATGAVSSANSVVSDLSSATKTITDDKRAISDAKNSVSKVQDGPDTDDIRNQTLAIREKQSAYDDYFTRAPFSGVLATVDAHVGDNAGGSTKIATLITKEKIAEISLNEVDAAKVKVGDKVTLTFDAIDGLTITGSVAEMDLIGTVSQGVVSYTVKIGFDTDDDRIKPGMTVSADIITDIQQNVLTVPTAAIHTSGDTSYVETLPGVASSTSATTTGIPTATAPTQVPVSIGLSGDDTTEILSGLSSGDLVVVRTITPSATTAKTTTTAPSLLGGGAGGGTRAAGGGGFAR